MIVEMERITGEDVDSTIAQDRFPFRRKARLMIVIAQLRRDRNLDVGELTDHGAEFRR